MSGWSHLVAAIWMLQKLITYLNSKHKLALKVSLLFDVVVCSLEAEADMQLTITS